MTRKRRRANIKNVRDALQAELRRCERLLERERLPLKMKWRQEGRRAGVWLAMRLLRNYINEKYGESAAVAASQESFMDSERTDRHG